MKRVFLVSGGLPCCRECALLLLGSCTELLDGEGHGALGKGGFVWAKLGSGSAHYGSRSPELVSMTGLLCTMRESGKLGQLCVSGEMGLMGTVAVTMTLRSITVSLRHSHGKSRRYKC